MSTSKLHHGTAAFTAAFATARDAATSFDAAYDAYFDDAMHDADLFGVTRDGLAHLTDWTDSSLFFDAADMDFIHSMF